MDPNDAADKAQQAAQAAEAAASGIWEFLLDKPLRIAVIIAGGFVLNLIVRALIRRAMNHIAEGDAAKLNDEVVAKKPTKSEETKRWLIQDSPVANARRAQRAKTVGSVLRSITTVVIVALVLLMVMAELGFDLAPVIASAGIVGVALGFGAQSLVKDYLSGLFLVAEDQFGIGDFVDLGDASGEVESVGLRVTQVRDLDGTLWHIRNGEILRVGNMSQGWARAVLDVPVPYDADLEQVSSLMLESARRLREDREWGGLILDEPEVWGVQALTGESVTIRLVLRTKPQEQWGIAREMRARLKSDLDAAGLHIPLVNQAVIKGGSAVAVAGPPDDGNSAPGGPLNPTS